MGINLGDIVKLKKPHPCGGDEWRVIRIGADIGLQCLNCKRSVLMERAILKRRIKSIVKFDNIKERV